MEAIAAMIGAPMNSFRLRKSIFGAMVLFLVLFFACGVFCSATSEPCHRDSIESVQYSACSSYEDDCNAIFQDIPSKYETPKKYLKIDGVCSDSSAFCFPSTLSRLSSRDQKSEPSSSEDAIKESDGDDKIGRNESWSGDYGILNLFNGRVISCSLSSRENRKSTSFKEEVNVKTTESISSSPNHVEISPAILEFGQSYTYFPSTAYLTVTNTCNDSVLHIYEPFSTDPQFYPCNFSEISLGPGETALICFGFLPRFLGSSTARLILQTNSGGFLIQAKGSAMESPYGITPFLGFGVSSESSSGGWNRNLSLSNSYDETVYIEEITARLSISVGQSSIEAEAICSVGGFHESEALDFPSIDEWLVLKNGHFGLPILGMKPLMNWEIGPKSTKTVLEIDFSIGSRGKILGAICMQVLRSSKNTPETIVVPLEAEINGKEVRQVSDSISVSLEILYLHNAGEPILALSLKNDASHLLSVIKITEVCDSKALQIKYVRKLLLFPGSDTRIAVMNCSNLHDSPPEVLNTYGNCRLLILTNDSASSQFEVSGQEIVNVCSRSRKDSFVVYKRQSETGQSRKVSSLGSEMQSKARETSEADESVLQNWKSHSTIDGFSVLDEEELVFPIVQVGSHHSKRIIVTNPSGSPVIMQLILNPGEIIEACKGTDGLIHPPSSGNLVKDDSTPPSKYGFSVSETALMEALVPPRGSVSFGPILFHPSARCTWRGSVLIRNNLSGVEWVHIMGHGGSLSLLLHEVSEPVLNIEFNLSWAFPVNVSCSQPMRKELYAKNTGDLPLEVRRIKVSGKDCSLDGFTVHTCRGFFINPGEISEILISYQTDFSASIVHRDLELVLATGILVIPMKATVPAHMLSVCKQSVFWVRVKRYTVAMIPVAILVLLVFVFVFPVSPFGSNDDLGKNYRGTTMPTTLAAAGKCSHEVSLGNCNFSLLPQMDSWVGKVGFDDLSDGIKGRAIPSSPDSEPAAKLSVSTEKEKGKKRRRKKKGNSGNKLAGLFEASSSHSGNSTPSSPLSPLTSASRVPEKKETKPSAAVSGHRRSNSSAPAAREPPPEPRKAVPQKPVLLPSPTFPIAKKPVGLHARAPGPNLADRRRAADVAVEKDQYTYDIWGDHFSRLQLLGKNGSETEESDSDSFFVKGPQTLMNNQINYYTYFGPNG